MKQFKMPTSFTVLFLIIIAVAVLTWIIPAGKYQTTELHGRQVSVPGTYQVVEATPQGAWDIFAAPVRGIVGSGATEGSIQVSLFVLVIGGFLGVVTKTGAIDAGIAGIVRRNKGREKWLIPILVPVFALGGTTFGMCEETMGFYALLATVMIAAGFDTTVAVAVILLGSGVGVMASTVNPFATGVASSSLGISLADGMGWRALLLVSSVLLTIWYIYSYASKVHKDPSHSLTYSTRENDLQHFAVKTDIEQATGTQKLVLWVFCLTFLVMIVSVMPWQKFGFDGFAQFNDWLLALPVIGGLVGKSLLPLGDWYFMEITVLFLFSSIVIALVARIGEEDYVDAFINGARDLLGVALIIGVARGIQVVMNDGQISATVLHWGEVGLSGLSPAIFSFLTFLFYIPMSFLIPSTSGLASATMPIIGGLGQFVHVPPSVVVTAFQSASGLVNLITPTSGVVMGALAIGRIPYGSWLKFCGKLLAMLFVLNAVIIAIAAVMG